MREVTFTQRISRNGRRYVITIPKLVVNRMSLEGQLVQVTIKVIE